MRGLPRPRFSVPSCSCLEAKGWLDFELDSLIFSMEQVDAGGRKSGFRQNALFQPLPTHLSALPHSKCTGAKLPGGRGALDSHPAATGWGWAVGPNQLLICCSEGLFVVLPPTGPGPWGTGSPDLLLRVRLPWAKVWMKWGSSYSEAATAPPPRQQNSALSPSLGDAHGARRKGKQRKCAGGSGSHELQPPAHRAPQILKAQDQKLQGQP